MPSTRLRLADVATQAQVSTATVSRVLNDKPGVSDDVRQRVLSALTDLGYERPTRLHTRPTGLVGLVLPDVSNPIFPAFCDVIATMLHDRGYQPVLCAQTPGGPSEDQYIQLLLDQGAAGIVFISCAHADTCADLARYHLLRSRGVPVVLVNGHAAGVDAPCVSVDDQAAVDLALRHLTDLGHRRIGLAVGPLRYIPAQRKHDAFLQRLRADGVPDPAAHAVTTLFTVEGGQSAAGELIDSGHTAIVCGSDLMALGAVRAARARGLRVPQEVSVVGFDDSRLLEFTDPALTTVRQPVAVMGRAVVDALDAEIDGTPVTRTELLFAPELVVRGSTGAGPAPGLG